MNRKAPTVRGFLIFKIFLMMAQKNFGWCYSGLQKNAFKFAYTKF